MVERATGSFSFAKCKFVVEVFLKEVFQRVLDRCPEDLQFFNDRIDKKVLETLEHVASSPFERMSYTEAVSILERSGRSFEFPVRWGADLQSEHERYLTDEHLKKPLVVTDYPKQIKAFYMYQNDDGRTVRAMDVLVPRVGEIVGGSQREHRHEHQGGVILAAGAIDHKTQAAIRSCGPPSARASFHSAGLLNR